MDTLKIEEYISSLPQIKGANVDKIVDTILDNFDDFRVVNQIIYKHEDGKYVCFDSKENVKVRFIGAAIKKINGSRPRRKMIDEVYQEIISHYTKIKSFEPHETVLNLNNCQLSFGKDGVFTKDHSKDYFHTYKLPYDYNPEAKCPIFEKFISETFDEKELAYILQEFIGYIFMNKRVMNLERALFLYGGGANGKSVILEVIKALVGEANVSHVELKNFAKENNIYSLDKKLVNIASDISHKNFASDVLKKIVSQENIEVKKLYHDVFTIDVGVKLMFALNQLPDSGGDTSYGLLRRLIILPFEKIVPPSKRDKKLTEKLVSELSGILNYAIKGYYRLLKQKDFTKSEVSSVALEEYKLQLNNLEYFLSEHKIEVTRATRTTNQTLYNKYKNWCKSAGIRPTTKNKLIAYIRSLNKYDEYKNNSVKGFKFKLSLHAPECSSSLNNMDSVETIEEEELLRDFNEFHYIDTNDNYDYEEWADEE